MARDLTERQASILRFAIETLTLTGQVPTIRAIGKEFGFSSEQGAYNHIVALVRKGYLARGGRQGFVILKDADGEPVSLSLDARPPEELPGGDIQRGLTLPEAAAVAQRAIRRRGERGWKPILPDKDGKEATISITVASAMANDWEAW